MFNYLFVFILATFIFGLILWIVSLIISPQKVKSENKYDLYECGFKAFDSAKQPIDIKFFLLAILFVIFDLETIILLPWLLTFKVYGYQSFYLMALFIIILLIGFIYEYNAKILNWIFQSKRKTK